MSTIRKTFPTPILIKDWGADDEANKQLEAEILRREASESSVKRRNINSWDSGKDLLEWELDAVEVLKQRIVECVAELTEDVTKGNYTPGREDMVAHAWANVSREGSYRKPHNHRACIWSGVYYVSADLVREVTASSGAIEFVDPRAIVIPGELPGSSFGGKVSIKPRAGRMVIFPHWLNHYVNVVEPGSLRICIAFNVGLEHRSVKNRRQTMKAL